MSKLFTTYRNRNNYGLRTDIVVSDHKQYIMSGGQQGVRQKYAYVPEYITQLFESDNPKSMQEKILRSQRLQPEGKTYILSKIERLISAIQEFLSQFPDFTENKSKYYNQFPIPKKSGNGFRTISEPCDELKLLQTRIALFLQRDLGILTHDACHAYTEKRSPYTNISMHQKSRHIIKADLKDFFPSINADILRKKLSQLNFLAYPEEPLVQTLIDLIITVATFEEGIPQGSPLSPYLSNIIMVEFDYYMVKHLRESKELFSKTQVMFTRYADDLAFSSLHPMDLKEILTLVNTILFHHYDNQIVLNTKKTKYLKSNDRCFITGYKLNQDQNITVGHEKKTDFKRDLHHLMIRHLQGESTEEEVNHILGRLAYIGSAEPNYAEYLERTYLRKMKLDTKTLRSFFTVSDPSIFLTT